MSKGIQWGAQGQMVYERTYSRVKPDGSHETWPDTVERVVDGNLALGDPRFELPGERDALIRMMTEFKILPAGRHLWASGVPGAQHLMNCWVSGWDGRIEDHFEFTFMRLMEGGGVGANYSNRLIPKDLIQHFLKVEIVCDPGHQDYADMVETGVISERYSPDWSGAFVVEDSREGWAAALVELIQSHYRKDTQNYFRVFDVSNVRPAGSRLKTFGGTASGPLPLAKMLQQVSEVFNQRVELGEVNFLDGLSAMAIDHAIAQCVVAGGVRRSARMAIMHWDDPQIEVFCEIKQRTGSHWTTNISVEVDDNFWAAIHCGNESLGTIPVQDKALKVLRLISEGIYHNGEPGFWDSTLANYGEPNTVVATNPCGEICLCPSEPCNLGHINLAGFVEDDGYVDHYELEYAHELMTRFLIRATFTEVSDPKSREILDRNRRIGVGHLGVSSFLALTGVRFSDASFAPQVQGLLSNLASIVDEAAADYSNGLRIPVPVKKRTVAPTGTVSKMPGVSEGIHPIFAKYFIRRIRLSTLDPRQVQTAKEYEEQGYLVEPDAWAENTLVVSMATKDSLLAAVEAIHGADQAHRLVQSADELTLEDHLNMQALYQRFWADNAVSYTVNFDPAEYSAEDIAYVLRKYIGMLKGTTMFPEKGMPQSPYERITKQQYDEAVAKSVADGVDEECANGSCPIR